MLLLQVLMIYAETKKIDLTDYIVIPMKEQIMSYDKPGFYMNIPRQIESFGNWGNYWRTSPLLEISENVFSRGDQIAYFYKIKNTKGQIAWIFGGDVLIASVNLDEKCVPWYGAPYDSTQFQIFYQNDQFYGQWGKYGRIQFLNDVQSSENPVSVLINTGRDRVGKLLWNPVRGAIDYVSSDNEIYHQSINLRDLPYEKILTQQDEWFWYAFEKRDFKQLLELKEIGYKKYDSSQLSREESPLFKSIKERDFKMIEFLIKNGYSQTITTGNYDGTISCLKDSIVSDDYEMASFLIKSGIGQNIGGEMGTDYDLSLVIRSSTPQMLQLFIDSGFKANVMTYGYSNGEDSSGGGSLIMMALEKPQFLEILLKEGLNPNQLSYSYFNKRFSTYVAMDKVKNPDSKALLIKYGGKSVQNFTIDDYQSQGLALRGTINSTQVTYRDSPNSEGNSLGFFEKDESIKVLNISGSYPSENKDTGEWPWLFVEVKNGQMGWVNAEFIDVNRSFVER